MTHSKSVVSTCLYSLVVAIRVLPYTAMPITPPGTHNFCSLLGDNMLSVYLRFPFTKLIKTVPVFIDLSILSYMTIIFITSSGFSKPNMNEELPITGLCIVAQQCPAGYLMVSTSAFLFIKKRDVLLAIYHLSST